MDTNRIKRFATEARNILLSGVVQRLTALGFQPDGTATEKPELLGGGAVFMGEVQSEDFYHKWMSLYQRMQSHSFREVAEEAAYTWFNRLVAIRIMVKNGLIPPVLEYEREEVRIPVIVTEARQGRMPQMDGASRQKLDALLLNDALTDEQFALLIVAYCHSNPIISKCFGKIADYTELLLPSNILKNDGFIDRLNADDYLSDDDYRSPELIGWLYQFYISERKAEVYAKKGKFEADEIPAATQIFTPNWIVKYMVQNTVGRIYLGNNPYSDIKEGMKYLVEPDEPTPADAVYQFDDIHDLKVADLACGSGHILNECFDLLYQIYIEEGYNRRRAVEDIFRYNLTGIDIDTRAKQLAMFALLLKACQKDRSFADGHILPRVLDMPQCDRYTWRDTAGHFNCHYSLTVNSNVSSELDKTFTLMEQADTLGCIMRFSVSQSTIAYIQQAVQAYDDSPAHTEQFAPLVDGLRIILALTQKYAALVMNPPYMGSGNMNAVLSNYVKKNYPDGKADLFAVFMQVAEERLAANGKYGMINKQSWMFLSSFEKLRTSLLNNLQIDNMLHLGSRTFDELSGEVVQNTAFVISNHRPDHAGAYFRLVDGKDCSEKERMFLAGKNCYFNISQKNFEKIPGCLIGYWASEKTLLIFSSAPHLEEYAYARVGMFTGDNSRFLKEWWEIGNISFFQNCKSNVESIASGKKWFPYNKGGSSRRWYGNYNLVVNYQNGGYEIYELKEQDGRNCQNYPEEYKFKPCITWSTAAADAFRYQKEGVLFDTKGMCMFSNDIPFCLAYVNSKVAKYFLAILSPGTDTQVGHIRIMPYIEQIEKSNHSFIESLVTENISISKQDWDAHETSWDFEENKLLAVNEQTYIDNIHWREDQHFHETGEHICIDPAAPKLGSLEWRVEQYKQKWTRFFLQLHANEEELNRQFIDIYGLQDELTPDVPLDEITILQQGEKSIENGQLVWHDDVIVKQLISYAVGCMMGRYSLDRKGLILANQGDGQKEYEALVPNSRFAIDDDGIIPLMSVNNELTDHVTLRFKAWLNAAFGEENFMDNLNFVERALNKRLEDYFLKDFWKDHKNKDMYQNRPIYWLFSSKKGAFQCIVYMHRMNAYTAEKVRTQYLLPHIEWLMTRQAEMQANAANLSTRERRELDNIGKQIDECREYHDRLHVIADRQIAFDLDDGVLVNYAKFGDVLAKLK